MKGHARNVKNALNEYKSMIHIKKRDLLVASIVAADCSSTDDSTVEPESSNRINPQEKDDCQNVFQLAVIGVKEGISEGIANIVRTDITNPILQMTNNIDFKSVDEYQINQLFTTIKERAEISESTNIWRQFVNTAGEIIDWREKVMTNVERMAAMVERYLGYDVRAHSDLRTVVIIANTEWAAQQTR